MTRYIALAALFAIAGAVTGYNAPRQDASDWATRYAPRAEASNSPIDAERAVYIAYLNHNFGR